MRLNKIKFIEVFCWGSKFLYIFYIFLIIFFLRRVCMYDAYDMLYIANKSAMAIISNPL